MKEKNDLIKYWLEEENYPFKGWDFSYLDGRWEMETLPWDFKNLVLSNVSDSDILLDMGTGDGNRLLEYQHPTKNTYVTEGYLPNYGLCKKTLAPIGIQVDFIENVKKLPYKDNMFDIVINRHDDYDLDEIYRILKPDGLFITQQVGYLNSRPLSTKLLGYKPPSNSNLCLEKQIQSVITSNFKILVQEEKLATLKFFDTGAIVYYAKIIEWEFPDFRVNECLDALFNLEEEIHSQGFVESIEHRYVLILKRL